MPPLPIVTAFADLPDPRRETKNKLHALADILTIAVCAVISGAEGWEAIAEYGRRKEAFFRRFLALENGIPSHDTFYNVFRALEPDAFALRFGAWMRAACEEAGLVPIAIDGKSARRARRDNATGCLCLVSAWATANHVTLAQKVVPDGTSEIGVIPELLRTLDLAGAIVTMDAAGCQVENAATIRGHDGHYVLAVKGNQPGLQAAVQGVVARACAAEFAGVVCDRHEETGAEHGRVEERYTTVIYDPVGLPADWADVAAVVVVGREREIGAVNSSTTHYFVTSHAGTAAELAGLIRGHWGIENGLHWVLDVAFREDESRTQDLNAGSNLALLRRVAVSLLKRVEAKGSIHTRRLMAGWDDAFLLKVLKGFPTESSA
jgi:predicted transposase YbfD/YdcC